MIDSLTVSVLLLVALAIAAVVGWDAWRSWRLRQLSVSSRSAERAPPRPGTAVERAAQTRPEPSLGPLEPGDAAPGAGSIRDDRLPDGATPRLESVQPDGGQSAAYQEPGGDADAGARDHVDRAAWDEPRPVGTDAAPGAAAVVGAQVAQRPAGSSGESASLDAQPAATPPESRGSILTAVAAAPGDGQGAGGAAGEAGRSASNRSVMSDRTDAIAVLKFSQPQGGDRLAAIAQGFRRVGGKPVLVEGLPAGGSNPDWELPLASRTYSSLRIGVLLANRMGPLNAMEFADFGARVQQIADSLVAMVQHPDMSLMLERARELDHDSARLDAQICLNVDAAETLSPAQLVALAGPLAIVERGNNRYARLGPRGEPLFSVALGDRPNRLSFLLDLPRVDPDLQAWPAMLEAVRVAVRRLPGKLVDDNGRALGDRQIEQIARDIDQRGQSLIEAGLRPGSPAALRVFN